MTTQKTMNAVVKKRFKVSTSVKLKHPFMLLFSTDMLHRNCAGTEEQPKIIKEYIFVISDDMAYDSYSVQHVRHIIHNYLVNTVRCTVKRLHEFTDGCSAQYKSRHCMGSHVLLSSNDFGYPAQRNYFETSHAKGCCWGTYKAKGKFSSGKKGGNYSVS